MLPEILYTVWFLFFFMLPHMINKKWIKIGQGDIKVLDIIWEKLRK